MILMKTTIVESLERIPSSNASKCRIINIHYWETVEDRWVHAAMRLTSTESSFHSCDRHLPRLSRGGQNVPWADCRN